MMQEVRGLKDMDLLINVSAGYPGAKRAGAYAGATSGLPIAAGSVEIQVPNLLPDPSVHTGSADWLDRSAARSC